MKSETDILQIFNDVVQSHGADVAVRDKDSSLTFAGLDTLSDSIAASLHNAQGRAVGVLVPRTKDIVVGAVAAFKAGGIYMPIDAGYPLERIEYMLKDSKAAYLLTTRKLYQDKNLDFPKENVWFFDGDANRSTPSPSSTSTSSSSPAMILYTSGTTGNPKGVVHTGKSIIANVGTDVAASGLTPDTNIAIMAGFSFIASQGLIMTGILRGNTLDIADEATREDIDLLYHYFQDRKIGLTFLPPVLATAMVEEYDMSGVTILSAGDKLRNFKAKYPCNLLNVFGSTEGSLVLAGKIKGDEETIHLGKPLPGIRVRIAAPQPHKGESLNGEDLLMDVPEGEAGELVYSGDIQAKEYLNLPGQTREKWYIDECGVRWFRMGDRVRRLPDGNICYMGRADNMVKIRGFRVETGEVEQRISQVVPSIEPVVVLRTVHGIDHLCCFYQGDKEIDTKDVSSRIGITLAGYMIPDVWVRVESLPRNANGKVMRRDLPVPSVDIDKLSAIYNEVEMRVVEVARLIVGNTISIDENFFECGGTSLGAIKLASKLKLMGIYTTGSKIMQTKVLRKVAAEARVDYERLWTPEQWQEIRESFSSRGEKIEKVVALGTKYEDMLIKYLMHPVATANSNVYVLKMDSRIDEPLLRSVINGLAGEFDFLRLFIVIHHHFPFQIVYTDHTPSLDVYDVPVSPFNPSLHHEDTMLCVREIYKHAKHAPYDPETDGMVRFAYMDTHDGCSFLFVKTITLSVTTEMARAMLHRMMEKLSEHYPDDVAIRDWREILDSANVDASQSSSSSASHVTNVLIDALDEVRKIHDNGLIRVYSPITSRLSPLVCFVHTGNTGSDAYYRLADKIGDSCAFSVIEPYNLFHQNDIQHGIKAIAHKYVEILRDYQPHGPYILGGWCYGGVVAHEMACQFQAMGERVSHLIMFDSHALAEPSSLQAPASRHPSLRSMARAMAGDINREYFETCPLFQDLRDQGLLEAMVRNSAQVNYDLQHHTPSVFHGPVTYFKPLQTPMAATGKALEYWKKMMEFDAGNYENFCDRDRLRIFSTPHEHDLMMDDESLAITVPILKDIFNHTTS